MQSDQNERLVFFTDAVIAITITLLVLDIHLPEDLGDIADGALARALADTWPQLRGYLISFAVIGAFWMSHHMKFALIPRSSRRLMLLNLLFLCLIGLVPLVTRIISENPGALATQVYAGLMALTGLALAAVWAHAARAGLVREEMPPKARRRVLWFSGLNILVFLLSIPLAAWNADLAKVSWALLLPMTFLQRAVRGPAGAAV